MILGAAVYSEFDAVCTRALRAPVDLGPVTLPQITGAPAAAWFALLAAFALFFFRWLVRRLAS